MFDQYQWNYNKVLPVYAPFDTLDSKSIEGEVEDCIEKASIAIQRHIGSKWEDDSYILVGKARFFASEFQDAVETFKYVNKKSKDDPTRHEALILLLRTFVEIGEYNNAIAVSDFLNREELNERNLRELYVARAFLYQRRNDYNQMVQNLVKAEEIMPASPDKARMEFIIGQVYQELGFEAEAYNYYENCLRNSPTYELAFYTKLNMAQVTQLTRDSEIKRVEKYFRKLLRDPKNLEYQDKIYYEWANFEFKQNNLDQAIANYKLSIKTSTKNTRQKAYSYLRLGQIYYDSIKDFSLAKSYYDSTVSTLPKDEEDYQIISQRQEILSSFVEQILTISRNDSLLSLSQLEPDSLYALAKMRVDEENRKAEEKKKLEKKKLAQATTAFDNEAGALIGTSPKPGAEWYFYNPSDISRGSTAFKRKWGDRPLADNWRRGQKSGGEVNLSKTATTQNDTQSEEQTDESKDQEAEIISLIAAVPKSKEQVQALLSEIEEAHYLLGNIYNFKLDEKQNASITFESLLSRFPNSEYRPEVLYQLFLIYKYLEDPRSELRGDELKKTFPESIYAKLVDNPNYREENKAATARLKATYNQAYSYYQKDLLKETIFLVDSALQAEPENEFSDNLKLIGVLAIGKIEGAYKYQFELSNFKKNYPDSELIPYVDKLIKTSEEYQINLVNSAKARFVKYFDQKHFLVVAYKNQSDLSSKITKMVDAYIQNQENLNTGNLILDDQYAMILINEMKDRKEALTFLNQFSSTLDFSSTFKGEKIYAFVISQDNFNIFYRTKDLNAYLNFFDQNYTQ